MVQVELTDRSAGGVAGLGMHDRNIPVVGVVELVSSTGLLNPLMLVMVRLNFKELPTSIVKEVWRTDNAKFDPLTTFMVADELVLVSCVESPLYEAVMDAEPVVVALNLTEQLPADRVQVLLVRKPPVEPGVRVKVIVPVGVFDVTFRSVTVAVMSVAQLVAPVAILQFVFGTFVAVLSRTTVMVARV
jgi:hypothetical protein